MKRRTEANSQLPARSRQHGDRRGGAPANVLVTMALLMLLFLVLTPSCGSARETGRQNTCRENLRKLAVAANDYHDLHGRYPGYMNPSDENPFLAHDGVTPVGSGPVSWVAALIDALDQPRPVAGERSTAESTPTGSPPLSASPTSTQPEPRLAPSHGYRETLICPSAELPRRGPQLSYVANCGLPDALHAIAPQDGRAGIPRDWPANGVFFDRYSDAAASRGPTITMTRALIRDPKDKTILFAENLNAGPYFIEPRELPGGDVTRAEMIWGAVWGIGPITVGAPPHPPSQAPSMQPPAELSTMNAARDHNGPATSYRYSRPSSQHPQGCNFVFVAGNVVFLRDTIDYFVFAKLMASDDADTKLPGSDTPLPDTFRTYRLADEDINP